MPPVAQLGDRVAVGTSWRPKQEAVAEVAHRWRWERLPTLDNGGYVWREGLLRIDGTLYRWSSSQESDQDGRRWVHVELVKESDGTVRTVEVGPTGQAVCSCVHATHHRALTCRHAAAVPPAVEDFDRELAGRLDRAAGLAETPELDFEF